MVQEPLQAHFASSGDFEDLLISALLWLEMMVLTLLMQLYLSLRVFRLKILYRGFDLGRCWLMRERK